MRSSVLLVSLLSIVHEGVRANKEMVDPNSKIRHSVNTRPLELNVDARETYNDKFMALMESACRPEPDGYFGATFGDPVKLQYGFQLEAQPLSNIMGLLDIVEDKIVDGILQSAFPQVCGFRRRRLEYAASGFRFLKFQEVGKFNRGARCEMHAKFYNIDVIYSFHLLGFRKM